MIEYFISHDMNPTYNVRVAKVFGLCSAVYLSLMMSEQVKAIQEKKLYNNKYFSIARDTIYDRTTLSHNKQKEIEENLIDCQVLLMIPFPNNSKKFYYFIDLDKLSLIVKNYKETEPSMSPETKKPKALIPPEAMPKMTAKQREIQTAMKAVNELDNDIYELIKQWVEVLVTKNGYCAQSQLRINLQDLEAFAKGNKQVKIDILRMAVKTGWKDIQYCITDYKKMNTSRNSAENKYQATQSQEQKQADLDKLKERMNDKSNLF